MSVIKRLFGEYVTSRLIRTNSNYHSNALPIKMIGTNLVIIVMILQSLVQITIYILSIVITEIFQVIGFCLSQADEKLFKHKVDL